MIRLWISLAGEAGVGKSTLATSLAEVLRRRGHSVDRFGEEELFTRPEFALVADRFRHGDGPAAGQFEEAYGAWLTSLTAGSAAITDWSPASMAGDLSWGLESRSEFVRHLRAVRELAGDRVILLHLTAPIDVAIGRAGEQRGEQWLERSDRIARADGHRQPDRSDRIRASTSSHAASTEGELEAAAEAGWPVHRVDATRSSELVLTQAIEVIDRNLAGT